MREQELAQAFDQIWGKSSTRNWILGRLGVIDGTPEQIPVPGRKGYVVVSMGANGDQGITIAKDKVGVANVVFQEVRMRRELGELVIREAAGYAGGNNGGGGENEIDHFMELLDVDPTGWNDGEVPIWNFALAKLVPGSIPAGAVYTAGNGISIAGVTISVKPKATNSGLNFDGSGGLGINVGNGLSINSNVLAVSVGANSGLTFPGGVLSLNVSRGLELISNAVRVDEDFAFQWAGIHQYNVTPNFNSNINFIGGNRNITAINSLTINPTDDLVLDPGGTIYTANSQQIRTTTASDSMSGIKGFRIWDYSDLGTGNDMMLTIAGVKVDELLARKFTADTVRVSRGEWLLAYSYGDVQEDFVMPPDEGTVDVWFEEAPGLEAFQLFGANHWLLLRTIDMTSVNLISRVWFSVVSMGANNYIQRQNSDTAANRPSRQQWRIKREFGGTTGQIIKKTETMVDYGLPKTLSGTDPGQGVIEMSTLYKAGGPYVRMQTFEDVAGDSPSFKNRVQTGNLSGLVDYATNVAWGFAAGDDLSVAPIAGFSGVTIDQVNGARFFNTDIRLYQSSLVSTFISRVYGFALRNDDTLFGHDLRNIAWYDNIPTNGDLSSSFATAKIGTWGGSTDRRLQLNSYGTSLSAIFLGAQGNGDDASLSVKSGWYGLTEGVVEISANRLTMIPHEGVGGDTSPRFLIGGDSGEWAISNLHVKANNGTWDDSVGVMIEQTGSGDSIIHWRAGGQTFSAGIDTLDGNKFKIKPGNSVRSGAAAIIIDPATGVVTINGLSGSGTGSLDATGGDGIDLIGTDINVDSTVVRTSRTITAGDGLQGGGNLGSNISLAVNSSVVRTTLQINTDGALSGGGTLTTNRTIHLNVLPNSGLVQTTELTLDPAIAGFGLDISAAKILSVSTEIARSATLMTAGAGLLGGGSLADNRSFSVDIGYGLVMVGNKVSLNPAVAVGSYSVGAGAGLTGGGVLTSNPVLNVVGGVGITVTEDLVSADISAIMGSRSIGAGTGLTVTGSGILNNNPVLNVVALPTSGLIANADDLTINPTIGGAGLVFTAGVLDILAYDQGGLQVNTNSIQIKLAPSSGLVTDIDGLHIDPLLAGSGLGFSDGVLNIGQGDGIIVAIDTISVDEAFAFTWTAPHVWMDTVAFSEDSTFFSNVTFNAGGGDIVRFNTTPQIDGDLHFIGGARAITSVNNFTLNPTGNLIISPIGLGVLPTGSITIDMGAYNRKWKVLHAAELYVENIVSQDVQATIGGRILVSVTSTLISDVAIGATTIDLKHNTLQSGAYIRLQTAPGDPPVPQYEVMKLTSAGSAITGGYRYNVTRGLSGSSYDWLAGDSVADLGAAIGDGYIDLTSVNTIMGDYGPTMTIYTRTGTALWSDLKPTVVVGNLKNLVNYSASNDEFGFAVGNDLTLDSAGGFSGLTADRTGINLYNTTINITEGSNTVLTINPTIGLALEAGVTGAPLSALRRIEWFTDLATSSTDLPLGFIQTAPISPEGQTMMVMIAGSGAGSNQFDGAVTMRSHRVGGRYVQVTVDGAFKIIDSDNTIVDATEASGWHFGRTVRLSGVNPGETMLWVSRAANQPTIQGHTASGVEPDGAHVIIDGYTGSDGYVSLNHFSGGNVYLGYGGGKVGVNTLSPGGASDAMFTVRSNLLTHNVNTISYVMALNRYNSDTASWYLGTENNAAPYNAILAVNNANMKFGSDVLGTFTPYMTIIGQNGAGNLGSVGIGTVSPDANHKFHAYGDILAYTTANTSSSVRNAKVNVFSDRAFGMELHSGQAGHSTGWATAIYGRSTDLTAIRFGSYAGNETGQSNFSEKMTILNTGNVGIGNVNPASRLHVIGSSGAVAGATYNPSYDLITLENNNNSFFNLIANGSYFSGIYFSDNARAMGIVQYQHSQHRMEFYTSGIMRFAIGASGSLTSPATYSTTSTAAVNMFVSSVGDIGRSTSARRYKRDIKLLDEKSSLQLLQNLKPIIYKDKQDLNSQIYGGFIAEEVYEAGGDFFVGRDLNGRIDSVFYDRLTAPLVMGWKNHQQRILELEQEVRDLKNSLRRLN